MFNIHLAGQYYNTKRNRKITKLHAGGLCLEPYGLETCKNLYWGNSQIDQNFQKPPGYFDIAKTYFDDHNHGISVTPEKYTEFLNKLQEIALNRPSGIPLHMTIDFEGDFKNDYTAGGIRQFPPPMGLAAIGDVDTTYKVGITVGKQLSVMGVTRQGFYNNLLSFIPPPGVYDLLFSQNLTI